MTITLEPDLEQKLQAAAHQAGQDVDVYVGILLRHQLIAQATAAVDRELLDEPMQREFEGAIADPLFVQDMNETMEAYSFVDAETARMLDKENSV